ncbi:MAG: GH36-type glycosyl hydrolase domain-containing protein [Steroidobacteraceae bacterium]
MDRSAMWLASPSGLRVQINANGSLCRFEHQAIALLLFVGNELEGGPANLYLRRHAGGVSFTPLLGPASPSRFWFEADAGRLRGAGSWSGIDYTITLALAQDAPAWFWHVTLHNTTRQTQQLDLTYAQDLALAPYGAVRLNEYYVSQYLDHTPLRHPERGWVIASRQNQACDARHPWSLIGSLRQADEFATDALELHGLASRAGETPRGLSGQLPARRLQHEHSMAIVRDARLQLEPGAGIATGFFGVVTADHPNATSAEDLAQVQHTLKLPQALALEAGSPPSGSSSYRTLFSHAPLINGLPLTAPLAQRLFGSQWRHDEVDGQGALQSFFHGADRHVVLAAKERAVLRPHGQLLRTGRHLTPDESALTSTAWMSGVFHSMVTQGHVSINRFLSTTHTYLGLFRSHGQRIFVERAGGWQLLNLPSAFEMAPDECRWIYRCEDALIEVRAGARTDPQQLSLSIAVIEGGPMRFLISHHLALGGDDGSAEGGFAWRHEGAQIHFTAGPDTDLGRRFPDGSFVIVAAGGTALQRVGGDELLFLDGASRRQPFCCLITAPSRGAELFLRGQLLERDPGRVLQVARGESLIPHVGLQASIGSALRERTAQLADIVPWYAQNALVHYLSPRGLEQYSGGGWGTRDVCQGPVELLLALGRVAPILDLLKRVFAAQNPDGDWPQWFMFFERERGIRAGDSHGDIVFWPLLVLAQYLIASGDAAVLEQEVRFFDAGGAGEQASVWQHAQRALGLIERRVIPGTALAAYGHGDWNDSLQPADPALREHMCSAWTVTLHFQTLTLLARALRQIGLQQEAQQLTQRAARVRADFQRLLLVDDVLAGYAIFEPHGARRYLLHPVDRTTGVQYSALAMIHAILEDLFTPTQARAHLRLIQTHLSAQDGVRLFDRPMRYHGGPQHIFQRAESATFFGREIGLMYMHAHLRYAQALAHVGEADQFFQALCQANPIGISTLEPSASPRQANCYYSSSDAAFADRYQASEQYWRVADGSVALDGGWRVYSSGAGIALGLIVRVFLGLSCEAAVLRVDPVMPAALDGLQARTWLLGAVVEVRYRVGPRGCGVRALRLNGQPLAFTTAANPHRRGAALIGIAQLRARLSAEGNTLEVELG